MGAPYHQQRWWNYYNSGGHVESPFGGPDETPFNSDGDFPANGLMVLRGARRLLGGETALEGTPLNDEVRRLEWQLSYMHGLLDWSALSQEDGPEEERHGRLCTHRSAEVGVSQNFPVRLRAEQNGGRWWSPFLTNATPFRGYASRYDIDFDRVQYLRLNPVTGNYEKALVRRPFRQRRIAVGGWIYSTDTLGDSRSSAWFDDLGSQAAAGPIPTASLEPVSADTRPNPWAITSPELVNVVFIQTPTVATVEYEGGYANNLNTEFTIKWQRRTPVDGTWVDIDGSTFTGTLGGRKIVKTFTVVLPGNTAMRATGAISGGGSVLGFDFTGSWRMWL